MMISTEEARKISGDLHAVVEVFNKSFELWMVENNCVAEFSWGYNHEGKKQLAVQTIDSIVFRKKMNHDFTSIEAAMKEASAKE